MLDRISDLIAERAGELADHDGVPAAIRHVHAAAHQIAEWVRQARDQMALSLPQAGAAVVAPVASPITANEPVELAEKAESLEPLEAAWEREAQLQHVTGPLVEGD
jgi:transposase-like protein